MERCIIVGCAANLVIILLTGLDLWSPKWWNDMLLLKSGENPLVVVVAWKKVLSMMPVIVRNYVVGISFTWFVWNSAIWYGMVDKYDFHWKWYMVPIDLFMINMLGQVWFWCIHRCLHLNAILFRYVHAHHHRHHEPFALTALDCTASEMILLNMPAVIFPLIVIQPPLITQYIWMILAATNVPFTHSGHNTPASDAYHALHHRKLNCNFGCIPLDKLTNSFQTKQTT